MAHARSTSVQGMLDVRIREMLHKQFADDLSSGPSGRRRHAIELLKAMRNHNAGQPLGLFAAQLLTEIQTDREVLGDLPDKMGHAAAGLKERAAWFAEKVSRLKLKHDFGEVLGTFEGLEFLVLGIHGK